MAREPSKNEEKEKVKEVKEVQNMSINTNQSEPVVQPTCNSQRTSDILLKSNDFCTPFETNDSINLENLDFGKLSMIMANGSSM